MWLGLVAKRAIADVVGLDSKIAYFSQQTNPVPSTLYSVPKILYLYSVPWTCTMYMSESESESKSWRREDARLRIF